MSNFFKTKSVKPVVTNTTFTLDFTRFLAAGATIASITSVTSSAGLTISGNAIVGLTITFTTTGGSANTEYLITATIIDSLSNTIVANNIVLVTNVVNCNYYGNTFTDYFTFAMNNTTWANSTMLGRIAALMQASRAIERLNFVGHKLVATQPMQFPRDSWQRSPALAPLWPQPSFPVEYDYPNDIEFATYEEAAYLMDNPDTQDEITNLGVILEQLGLPPTLCP
jgi:hypothetical protein